MKTEILFSVMKVYHYLTTTHTPYNMYRDMSLDNTCCPLDLILRDCVEIRTRLVRKQSGYLVVTAPSTYYNCPTATTPYMVMS